MSDIAIKIENLKKQYKLGAIGGGTLRAELESWWARKRGKEDPNLLIGQTYSDGRESFWALDGIDLEIHKGEALGIIGANGAGKSTLLKILSRVTAPTTGDIWINGRIASMLEVGTGFHGEMTGRENIYMNGAILGMSKKEVDAKIEDIIDFSECRQFIDTPVKRYSSGMYVKLAFAVAAHLDSEILIMDEVLAVGDMKFQKKCLGKMGDAAGREGKTVLYVSHNMATIRNLCTRCIVLNKGKIIFDGDTEQAISIYLENEITDYKKFYDLRAEKRAQYDQGIHFKTVSIEFLNKEMPYFSQSEPLEFRISWKADIDIPHIRLFIPLYDADTGAAIGGSISESFEVKASSVENKQSFKLCIKNLAEGKYFFEIVFLSLNVDGSHHTYDRVKRSISFEVTKDTNNQNIIWNTAIYGHVILPEMRVI